MIKKWLILVFMMSFLAACGSAAVTDPVSAETSESVPAATPQKPSQANTCIADEWSLEFHRSGGFAGFDENLALNSDGELAVNSTNPQNAFERSLSADEVQRISDLLEAACPFEAESKADNCADCFAYTLTVNSNGEKYQIEATDVTLTDEQSTLVSELQQYFNKP